MSDTWESSLYGLPYPVYFYFYSKEALPDAKDSMVIGNCPSLLSVQFSPYLTFKDFDITPHLYDIDRFGEITKDRPKLDVTPSVFRINSINEDSRVKELKTTRTYPQFKKDLGINKGRYWGNESKLYNFPYGFAMLTDGISTPLQIKYHLAPKDNMTIKVRSTLSDRCSYGLFIDNYKGDKGGQMEAVVSGDIHELPCSSSAYNQWYASSKNATAQNVQNSINQAFLSTAQSNAMTGLQNSQSQTNQMLGVGSALFNGHGLLGKGMGIGSAIIGGGMQRDMNNMNNSFAKQNASLQKQQAINSVMAQTKDLNNTPNTMISMGSDFIYGYNKQGSALKLFRYGLTTEYATRLGDYFALYGYKQNKLMDLSTQLRSRHYYNYIKTIGCNISSKKDMSKNELEIFKNIFDNGVTIWHVGRGGVTINDFSKDNMEVLIN